MVYSDHGLTTIQGLFYIWLPIGIGIRFTREHCLSFWTLKSLFCAENANLADFPAFRGGLSEPTECSRKVQGKLVQAC